MSEAPNSPNRLAYLDFLRGLAAVIMLQGHTFHSFAQSDIRNGSAYILSQFVGGMPPALFLFLTGVTLAFRMHSMERKGATPWQRVVGALRRSGYLIVIAFALRLQLWLFSWPNGNFGDVWKVDILNCMALAILVLAPMALLGKVERPRLAAVLGLAIAVASPLVSQIDWAHAPWLLRHYIAPSYDLFPFFPWASFLAFGIAAGAALRQIQEEHMDKAIQWSALLGGGLIIGGRYFADLPYTLYASSEFWLNSPALIFIKLGVVLWMMAGSFAWTRYISPSGWSWIRVLGTHSLLVYWVHIELVYGRWLGTWKDSLDTNQIVWASVGIILLMLGLCVYSERRIAAKKARKAATQPALALGESSAN